VAFFQSGQLGAQAADLAVDAGQLGLGLVPLDVTVAVAGTGQVLDLTAE
jgi:hypothetical protein